METYRLGRVFVDECRPLAEQDDELRWALEDLEEMLLDLKLCVLQDDVPGMETHTEEILRLFDEFRP